MKIIQLLFVKLMSACVLLLGIALIAALFTDGFPLIDPAKTAYLSWPPMIQKMAWAAAGVALVFIGFIGLMPMLRRRARQVSFAGPHGDVFYDLDSVENTIERVVGRMTEIKSIDAHVVPAEDNRRVEVSADVVLNPTGGSARDAATLVSQQIERAAEQMLGEDGVTKVVLRVKKILVDMKAPLLMAPSAPGHEAKQEFVGVEEAEREAQEERQAAIAKAERQAQEERRAAEADERRIEDERRSALAEAARQNAAAEAAIEEPVPVLPVAPTKAEEEEEYSYLPEDEEEAEKPLATFDEEPTPSEKDEDKSVLSEYDDNENLPPLESINEDKDSEDRPRQL